MNVLKHLHRWTAIGLMSSGLVAQTTSDSPAPAGDRANSAEFRSNVFSGTDWILDLGAFNATVDSNIQVNGNGGNIGTLLDFESDLGLSKREVLFNASLSYHGWDRWSAGVEWFELNRSSRGSLRRDIEWGQTLLPAEAVFDTYFNVQIVRVFGGYELWRNEDTGVGLGLGIHGAGMKAGMDAEFTLAGGNLGSFEDDVGTGAILPLPNFGIWANHLFTDRLLGSVRLDGFALEIDEYKGALWNLEATLRYEATERFSIGAGYSFFRLDVEMNRSRWNGKGKFSYRGPKLFLFYAW